MEIREEIKKAIKAVLVELNLPKFEPQIEHPENPEHGDYSSNVALVEGKKSSRNSKELADKIVEKLSKNTKLQTLISNIQVAAPGFINFWLSKDTLSKELDLALKDGERHSENKTLDGQTLMVEFAHPNTHKEFHIGHLRNIVLGEAISRLLVASGAKVIRANYQGDVGLHIAKALWGIKSKGEDEPRIPREKEKFLADCYVVGNKAYNENTKDKSEIEEINKELYRGDKELVALWKKTREWSLKYFDSIYKQVGTKFDRLYFESEVADKGKDIVRKYLDTVFKESEGAVIYPGERYGLHNRVFITKFGLPTYEAKDVGLAHLQFAEFNPDKIIHIVGPEQTEYFKVVFSALEKILPESRGKEFHFLYGWVRLKTGKMSSRTGEVVAAVWLLDEVKSRLKKNYKMRETVALQVAVGAVKYSMLRLNPGSEIAFDIDESIRLDGDSGPYLQYTYARARSVLRKAPATNYELRITNYEFEPTELSLLRAFYKFPEVVQEAASGYAPNLLCNFLYDLASKYNIMYNNLPILEAESKEKKQLRLALTQVTANILKVGLNFLGIQAPERM